MEKWAEKVRSAADGRAYGTYSCGCLAKETAAATGAKSNLSHGASREGGQRWPEYRIWSQVIDKCSNPKNPIYHVFGGRGVRVCERWRGKGGFANFIADVGRRPSAQLVLRRHDPAGHYEPGNVAWLPRIAALANPRFGERHPRAVLDTAKVRKIRRLRRLGKTLRGIGEAVGAKLSTVANVLYDRSWRHVST